MAPAVEMSPLKNTADGGGAEASGLGNLIGGLCRGREERSRRPGTPRAR
jgi:hypothetical protein